MITARIQFTGISPMSQQKYLQEPKLERELPHEYEERVWRKKMHTSPEGEVLVPALAIKNCIAEAVKFLSSSSDDMKIQGKGKATYTKHFESGILVTDPLLTGVKADDVNPLWLNVPTDGQRGGKKRVPKAFPEIQNWKGEATVYVLDEVINREIFQKALDAAGMFIGLGSLRVRNNGIFGRFKAEVVEWKKGM